MSALAVPPHSLESLRAAHLQLLKDWPKVASETSGVERATMISEFACLMGERLEDPVDRDAAQGIVDYWTAALANVPGAAFPELRRLQPLSEDYVKRVVRRAGEAYAGLGDRDREKAEDLFVALHRGDPAARRQAADDAPALTRRLLDVGVLIETPEGVEIADAKLLASKWPELRLWLATDAKDRSAIEQVQQAAALWEDYGRKPVNLLAGAALAEAGRYERRCPGIREFVRASRRARTFRLVRLALLGVAIIGVIAGGFAFARYAGDEQRVAVNAAQHAGEQRVLAAQQDLGTAFTNFEQLVVDNDWGEKSPTETLPPGAGFIWIGSAEQPLLLDLERDRLVPPAEVLQGGLYRLRSNMRFRTGYPDDAYRSAPEHEVVLREAVVRVMDSGRTFRRPLGAQYWRRVALVPQVSLQPPPSGGNGLALAGALRAGGYLVGNPHTVIRDTTGAERTGLVEIRYFVEADRPRAERLAALVRQTLNLGSDQPVSVRLGGGKAPPAGLLLLADWQALGRGGRRPETGPIRPAPPAERRPAEPSGPALQ